MAGVFGDDFGGVVGAVVVGDDDLVGGAGLVEEGEYGLFEVIRLVECGDSYGEGEGTGHQNDCNGRYLPPPLKYPKSSKKMT